MGRTPLGQIRFDQDRRMTWRHVLDKSLQLIRYGYVPPCADLVRRRQSLDLPPCDRTERYQTADGTCMIAGEQPGSNGAPGMRDDMNPRAGALRADVIDRCANLGGGFQGAAKRRIAFRRRIHVRGTCRAAKTREIESPDVEAVAVQMIGP